jgi:decaprenyl-phosphate phosphoribosyltransferase
VTAARHGIPAPHDARQPPALAGPAPAEPDSAAAPVTARTGAARPKQSRARWAAVVLRASRPRQWPKNFLVLAAPVAGATFGRPDGLACALVALAAFTAASAAVYLVNDVADAGRDRQHPVKRARPVAAGDLRPAHALAVAGAAMAAAASSGLWIAAPGLTVAVLIYLAISLSYSLALKHVPGIELAAVASGFVLRAVGGAAATRVQLSGWFLTVSSLGALMVAVSKRRGEVAALGHAATSHRPVLRWYGYGGLKLAARGLAAAMVVAYALWALSGGHPGGRVPWWHLASIIPLAAAVGRFGWLTGQRGGKPVEDLIIRDRIMAAAELAWLLLFAMGMATGM